MTIVSSLLFESFKDVPASWYDICGNDLGMDLKVLDVLQRTLADQCRCWALMVLNEKKLPVACAALCLFPVELIETNAPVTVQMRNWVRKIWPGFLKMDVLFCGLPVPAGATHLRIQENVPAAPIIAEIDRTMQLLAKQHSARLLVFKELDNLSDPIVSALSAMGYVSGGIPPMHLLDVSFAHFSEYCNALKSRYRAQIMRSQKKLSAAGFDIIHGRGKDFVMAHFDDATYQLYVEVQRRAKQKLELMPPTFFTELASHLDDEVLLTLIRRNGRTCAFTFSITRGDTHYNMYSGLDYALNNEGDLYFNLFYNDMDQAFQRGVTSLHLGQTSDDFKSRLGTHTQPLWFFARTPLAIANKALRFLGPFVFPKVLPVEPNDVFNTDNAGRKLPSLNPLANVLG